PGCRACHLCGRLHCRDRARRNPGGAERAGGGGACAGARARAGAPPRGDPTGAARGGAAAHQSVSPRAEKFLPRPRGRFSRADERLRRLGAQHHRPGGRDHRHHARDLSRRRPCRVGADELVQPSCRAGDAMTTRVSAVLRFVRARLFATPLDALVTLACCWALASVLARLARWLVIEATFRGTTRDDCTGVGACWVFIRARFGQFMYGFYPVDQRWRVDLIAVVLLLCAGLLCIRRLPHRRTFALGLAVIMPPLVLLFFYGGP